MQNVSTVKALTSVNASPALLETSAASSATTLTNAALEQTVATGINNVAIHPVATVVLASMVTKQQEEATASTLTNVMLMVDHVQVSKFVTTQPDPTTVAATEDTTRLERETTSVTTSTNV